MLGADVAVHIFGIVRLATGYPLDLDKLANVAALILACIWLDPRDGGEDER